MRKTTGFWLLVASWWVSACATSQPVARAWEDATPAAGCESPEEDSCVTLACEEGLCGFFRCEDVVAVEAPRSGVERVQFGRPGLPVGPARPGRWWTRSPGLRGGAEPVMTFRWYAASQPLPLPPRTPLALPAGRFQKHHIFPQAEDLALWFKSRGINIHDYTLLIPEHVHRRIHAGGPAGGLWNMAWREFKEANRDRPIAREEIYRHAGALIFRFELTGPVQPYFRQLK
ncbi:TIGR02269 family lipoprotein [Pyxidicoccus trucidator]|uniref:SitA6 family polymorphic toxin lipoprotein n=1 Tax=Pyxidicoccus trucidator TaxID=2709662 RepID=UPI0013DCC025|nr:TIGR02269 family lipoprotein [Pyxidicoccus trucidator]